MIALLVLVAFLVLGDAPACDRPSVLIDAHKCAPREPVSWAG